MASTKPKSSSSKGHNKRTQKPSSSKKPSALSPSKQKSKVAKKTAPIKPKLKKRRVYTEAELNIPKLNTITPAGVNKPKGKKKGKVFVDDQESMMTIMALVNADKEGQIESKMMRARQMEEIRQARIAETEARAESKKQKLEDTKNELRKKKNAPKIKSGTEVATLAAKANKKHVSFG